MTPVVSEPSRTPPRWPHCGHGAAPENPVGCRGINVDGRTACLAHLTEADRAAHLAALAPGADVDHSGTAFTEPLLRQLLDALYTPSVDGPRFGKAVFTEASFSGLASFEGAHFAGDADFRKASFFGDARFDAASFPDAHFHGASFSGSTSFYLASFTNAYFTGATFSGWTWFGYVRVTGAASFWGARFEALTKLGPLVCGKEVNLTEAVFSAPGNLLEFAARSVRCTGTQWTTAAKMRLRYADVDLSDALLEFPLTIAVRYRPVAGRPGEAHAERVLEGEDPGVRLTSVDGVDASHLVLQDIDLSVCRFAGAFHLDQLRVDGWCTFARTPRNGPLHRRPFPRWSARRSLAEEHHWRSRRSGPSRARGWMPPPNGVGVLQPGALAALYRQLRKSLEDGKNEPDAADFYYGEMEMRRKDTTRSSGERALVAAYWALSGYGLRAVRALAWLVAAMVVTVLALMLWGLPEKTPEPQTTGRQVGAGQEINLTTRTPDPVNPTGPLTERLGTQRFEKALSVTINSVVFRSSGQDLTTTGTYLERASRIAEPVLLGLALLAIRNRVKR